MRRLISTAVIAILTACGGGGGDGDSGGGGGGGGGGATPSAALPLTSTNYVAASQEAYSSSNYLQQSGGLLTGVQVADDPMVIRALLDQVVDVGRWFSKRTPLVTGVTTTETESCAGGGTLTGTVNDQNGNEDADPGDSVVVVAANCRIGGSTLNGTLRAVFSTVTGSFGEVPFAARLVITAENFNVATAAGSATGNGNIEAELSFPTANGGSISISTSNFTTVSNAAGAQSTRTLSSFRIQSTVVQSGNTTSASTTISGTVTSTALGSQSMTVSTVRPLVTVAPALYPSSGQILVTGAANSKTRLTAQNATTLLIELDANGDGVYETSTTRQWRDLV